MRIRLNLLTLIATVIGLLLVPTVAFAYAPSGDDFITCVAGGDNNVECAAGIFDPNTDVDVLVEASTLLDTTVTADDDGEIDFDFDVPPEHEDSEIKVTLSGTKNGEPFVLSEVVGTITDGEVIANAGSNAGLLALGAVGAIAIGGGALYVSKRKHTGTTV